MVTAAIKGSLALFVALLAVASPSPARATEFVGSEFRANTTTSGAQATERARSVAMAPDGRFVVVWRGDAQDGSGQGIIARRFTAEGSPSGPEFIVNTTTSGNQRRPDIAVGGDGRFTIVWHGPGTSGTDCWGRRFDSDGNPIGDEFRTNTHVSGDQHRPNVAMSADGVFVVGWSSNGQDGSGDGMFGQRYHSDGTRAGAEFQINTYTTGEQRYGAISMTNSGASVIVWQSLFQDGGSWGVFGRRYDSSGQALGSDFQVNEFTPGLQAGADVQALEDGGFVVAYDQNDGSSFGIFARRFDSNGDPIGSEILVPTITASFQRNPAVAAADDGTFVVSWHSASNDGSETGVAARVFAPSGAPVGDEFRVSTHTPGRQYYADIAGNGDDGYVVMWESDGQDGSSWGVYGQLFSTGTPLCGNGKTEIGEECDDGGTVDGDGCDSNCTPTACGNAVVTSGEQCDDGAQSPTCDGDCTAPACDDGILNTSAGEECEPPTPGICNDQCIIETVCGDEILGPDEECDDGNAQSGDGCDDRCLVEGKFCLVGEEPDASGKAQSVAFASTDDPLGSNGDRNKEIFRFDKRKFDKLRRRGTSEPTALSATLTQLTESLAPAESILPALSPTGRFVAFSSSADLVGSNGDGNFEIFQIDSKVASSTPEILQVSDTSSGDNLRANLRTAKGNFVLFDSPSNLRDDLCVQENLIPSSCQVDEDCATGACGNSDGNREVFQWIRQRPDFGIPLRQLTAAPFGDSLVGRSTNFNSAFSAFESTADLTGRNEDGNSEIFRLGRNGFPLDQITETTGPSVQNRQPAQARRARIAFVSSGDLDLNHPSGNADGNDEIFLWKEGQDNPFRQLTASTNCSNANPSIDSRGRFVAFDSDCDLLGSNPGRSIFFYDDRAGSLAPLTIRGPSDTDAAQPQMSKKARVITFRGNIDSEFAPAVCFFNTAKGQLEGPGLR